MKLKKRFVLRKLGETYCAICTDDKTLIPLNPSGYLIFSRLLTETTEGELVDAILEVYDVSREVAEIDVRKFLQMLREKKLITRR